VLSYEYADGVPKRNEYDLPGCSIGEGGNAFVLETILCDFVSVFRQVTVSPGRTTTSSGWKPVAVMLTVTSAVESESAVVAPASAATARNAMRSFFMVQTPSGINRITNYFTGRRRHLTS
jgi:hypothetical protein